MWIRSLSALECTNVLEENRVGRLACCVDNRPYVVPIHYAHSDNHLYAFSLPGKKIEFMRANPFVSVLVEQHKDGAEWRSAIAEGRYEELPDRVGHKVQRDHAWSVLSRHANWWEPGTLKPVDEPLSGRPSHVFFRITIDRVSGREAVQGK